MNPRLTIIPANHASLSQTCCSRIEVCGISCAELFAVRCLESHQNATQRSDFERLLKESEEKRKSLDMKKIIIDTGKKKIGKKLLIRRFKNECFETKKHEREDFLTDAVKALHTSRHT